MVKFWANLLVILFMLIFVMGCTSTRSSQTSGESPKISTKSQKKSEEWIKAEVTNGRHKYSYKVPGWSEPASKEFFDEMSKVSTGIAEETGGLKFNSAFFLDKNHSPKHKIPWVAVTVFDDSNKNFEMYSTIVKEYEFLKKKAGAVVCENNAELIEAIHKQPHRSIIISKDKKALFYKFVDVDELENEKYVSFTIIYIGENSAVYFTFLEKEKEFKKQLPMFLKIGDTVTLVK
ncbi:hypothetical protein [Aneurinibacillus uraniidurans]|uniref:hypothetical protein n=1 Tax=Aneurinibacillus uraniidurans TaxID=2966586 RepID=UPI00234B1FFC|nr:hypothetical protein [Aneurinibacillus sp. B1]WCN39353.1 hypothetical protein PO771_08155 [Aneurinibacillus sp. B1]